MRKILNDRYSFNIEPSSNGAGRFYGDFDAVSDTLHDAFFNLEEANRPFGIENIHNFEITIHKPDENGDYDIEFFIRRKDQSKDILFSGLVKKIPKK